jgi:hypothetical protein
MIKLHVFTLVPGHLVKCCLAKRQKTLDRMTVNFMTPDRTTLYRTMIGRMTVANMTLRRKTLRRNKIAWSIYCITVYSLLVTVILLNAILQSVILLNVVAPQMFTTTALLYDPKLVKGSESLLKMIITSVSHQICQKTPNLQNIGDSDCNYAECSNLLPPVNCHLTKCHSA